MRLWPAVVAAMASAAPLAAQQPLFSPAPGRPVVVGRGSGTVLVTDLDGDGHADLLTRMLEAQSISVHLGDSRGFTPAPRRTLRFDYPPSDMKLGDVNGDGILDLVTTHSRRDVVDIFIGSARGDFARAPGSPIVASTAVDSLNKRTLHLVDLDADGDLDIVTANGRRRNTLSTLLGDGRGGFTRGPTVRIDSGRDGYAVEFGDVDGDGRVDVVAATRASFAANAAGRIVVLRGDGRLRFRPAPGSPFATEAGPSRLALGDLDGDERADILITHADGRLTSWRNAGGGRFQSAPDPGRLEETPYSPVIADLNGDGRADIVAATVNSVTVLLNRGTSFSAAAGSPYRAGPGAYHVTAADVNADKKLDLISSNFEAETVAILLAQ